MQDITDGDGLSDGVAKMLGARCIRIFGEESLQELAGTRA